MPARTRAVSLVLRFAVYAAAVAALLLAPDPSDSVTHPGPNTVTFRATEPAAPRYDAPSPVRIGLVLLLLAGAALGAGREGHPWR
jgi:hypothetical protein